MFDPERTRHAPRLCQADTSERHSFVFGLRDKNMIPVAFLRIRHRNKAPVGLYQKGDQVIALGQTVESWLSRSRGTDACDRIQGPKAWQTRGESLASCRARTELRVRNRAKRAAMAQAAAASQLNHLTSVAVPKQTLKRNGISRLAFWNRCTMHEMSGTAREASREAFSWGVRGRRSVDDMWQRRNAVHAVAST